MKKITIEIPIWEFDLTIMVGGNVKNILHEASKRKFGNDVIDEIIRDDIHSTDRGASYFCKKQYEAIVWVRSTKIDRSTINHEVTHIVDWASKYIGAMYEMEFRAYTVEYLNRVIPQTLKKLRDEKSQT
jgi:hypothetical protein